MKFSAVTGAGMLEITFSFLPLSSTSELVRLITVRGASLIVLCANNVIFDGLAFKKIADF